MFEKKNSINIDNFSVFAPGLPAGSKRIKFLDENRVLLIENDADQYIFRVFSDKGEEFRFTSDIAKGQFQGALWFDGFLWLEFHETIGPYEEDYLIYKSDGKTTELIASFTRESYAHDMAWHRLFIKDGALFVHLIRHNRFHHYQITNDEAVELDVMEGGRWYLAGPYPLCIIGSTLEIYDADLNLVNTAPSDGEIDDIKYGWSPSPAFLAFTLTDLSQEETILYTHHPDAQSVYSAYLEYPVADLGVSGGRVWLNPYEFTLDTKDLGGLMVYDRFASPLYIHLRPAHSSNSFGAYPPPFHRSEGVFALTDGLTLVTEATRLKVFDYNCHNIQELSIAHPECFALSPNSQRCVILYIDRGKYAQEGVTTHKDAELVFYEWNALSDGGKVIEMLRFQK